MSWIWEKSATWRWLVAVTKRSPAAMAAFTIGMCVVPYYAGQAVMSGTSMVTKQGTSLEQQLRARQTLEHKVRSIIAPDVQCADDVTQGLELGTLLTQVQLSAHVCSFIVNVEPALQVLAKANRERLRVLLGEAEKGGLRDNERYAAALRCVIFSKLQETLYSGHDMLDGLLP